MNEPELLAARFEQSRTHLRGVAYKMLGSLSEADDAVQEAWLRLSRSDTSEVANLRGWLTTVVARVCLDMLRSRKARREDDDSAQLPDPIVSRADATTPEGQTMLADAVGLALVVVLETLAPAERLAFVLHDMFATPFDEIAEIVGCEPAAARQLASRARRRVQGAAPVPDADIARQREVVEAFMSASRNGDFEALLAVLHPDVVLRGDRGPAGPGGVARAVRGASKVAKGAVFGAKQASAERVERHVLVNGAAGVAVFVDGQPYSLAAFTVVDGKIVEINVLADPERLRGLNLDGGGLPPGGSAAEGQRD